MKTLEIKHGNEFLQVHKGEQGAFVVFGARATINGKEQSNAYELNLTKEDIDNLKKAL